MKERIKETLKQLLKLLTTMLTLAGMVIILQMAVFIIIGKANSVELDDFTLRRISSNAYRICSPVTKGASNKCGNAFFVSHKGQQFLLTNYHVCINKIVRFTDSDKMIHHYYKKMTLIREGHSFDAKVVKADINKDLCALETDEYNGNSFRLSDKKPHLGQKFYLSTIHPKTYNYELKAHRLLTIVKGNRKIEGFVSKPMSYYLSLKVIPGMSGSAVLDSEGKLVSVIWGMSGMYDYLSFSVTYKDVRSFMNETVEIIEHP